jgi:hypothetical protein
MKERRIFKHESLEHEIERLNRITTSLRYTTLAVAAATLAVVFYGVFIAFFFSWSGRKHTDVWQGDITFNVAMLLVVTFVAVSLIVYQDIQRRKGNVIYEEISDEFQREGALPSGKSLEARLILRSFVHSSELPLAPGRYGPLIYFLVNIAVTILVVGVLRPSAG